MTRTVFIGGLLLALGVATGWTLRPAAHPAPSGQAPLRCPMHTWITAPATGKCTLCGMTLVRAGEPALEVCGGPIAVTLSAASATVSGVRTVAVARQPLERTLRVGGTLEVDATRRRYLTAWADGRVDRVFVNSPGAEVRAGEPLFALFSRSLLSAQQELLQLAQAGRNADAAVAEQRLQMMQLGFTYRQLDELLATREPSSTPVILAPHGGTVLTRDITEGQWVRTGDRLFEIADLSRLWAIFEVPAGDRAWLRPGQEVRVTAGPVVFTAPVAFIEAGLDPVTGTLRARVEFENRDGLAPGTFAEGRVSVVQPAVLAVPRSAILDTGTGPLVWVEHGTAYEARPLQLGRRGDTMVEVLAGLAEGERVVAQGALLLDAEAQLARAIPR